MFSHYIFLMSLLSRVFFVASRAACPGWAFYNLTFVALWNEKARPPNFDGSKFSEVIGVSHNSNYSLWEPGKNAPKELNDLLKIPGPGSSSIQRDINALKNKGKALKSAIIRSQQVSDFPSPGNYTLSVDPDEIPVKVNSNFSLVSFVSWLWKSPDWFTGVSDLDLCDDAVPKWKSEVLLDAVVWDAGTDSGKNFSGTKSPIPLQVPITKFQNFPRVGYFVFTKRGEPSTFEPTSAAWSLLMHKKAVLFLVVFGMNCVWMM